MYSFLDIPYRDKKPREKGITMVLDKGYGLKQANDLMIAENWFDIVKLGWCTPLIFPENILKNKIKLYIENNIEVCTGGTFLEFAYNQNKFLDFLNLVKKIGFTSVEVSNGIINLDLETKAEIIKTLTNNNLKVYSEVGKKNPELDNKFNLEQRIIEAKNDLKNGAYKVIIEGRASGTLGIYDKNGSVKENMAHGLVDGLGLNNIIFEAPKKKQQVWLILNYGPDVNLGNINPNDVISLETLRKGLRGDTFGKIH